MMMTAQRNVNLLMKLMTSVTMGLRKKIHEKESEKKTTNLGRTQAKQEKKRKLEKSLESLQRGLREVAEKETESFLKLEDLRHGREMQYQLKMKERDNERTKRREET